MCICLAVKQSSNEALSPSLPAGVTLTKTQDLRHPVTFVHHWLHLWLMNNSRSDLCVDEGHKQRHAQSKRSRRHGTYLITDQYFTCSPSLFRCWLASRPKATAQGLTRTYMQLRSLTHLTRTLKLLRAVVCFDWRVGHVALTPHWHSIPFRHTFTKS